MCVLVREGDVVPPHDESLECERHTRWGQDLPKMMWRTTSEVRPAREAFSLVLRRSQLESHAAAFGFVDGAGLLSSWQRDVPQSSWPSHRVIAPAAGKRARRIESVDRISPPHSPAFTRYFRARSLTSRRYFNRSRV